MMQLRDKLFEMKEAYQTIIREHSEELGKIKANQEDLEKKFKHEILKNES
jgi:hypothetical protein